jgi:hypothetical protein
MTKSLIAALCLTFAVSPLAIAAQQKTDTAKPKRTLTAHQQRFADCAHKSKGLKRDAHNKFMHDCLTGHDTTSTKVAAKPASHDKTKK